MNSRAELKVGAVLVTLGLAVVMSTPVAAADDDEIKIDIKARAVSPLNITRAAADLLDIRITRWTSDEDREVLIRTLQTQGNHALAAALNEEETTGWVSFDPRGGAGPGRDPRRSSLKYAREITTDDSKEIILVTNHYPGYGRDPMAADGAKLQEFPVSFVLLKLHQDEDGEWTGLGRMFVGARLKYDTSRGRLVIDEFPMDPVYLKDVRVK